MQSAKCIVKRLSDYIVLTRYLYVICTVARKNYTRIPSFSSDWSLRQVLYFSFIASNFILLVHTTNDR